MTFGGLDTLPTGEVLTVEKQVAKGLYSAGRNSAGLLVRRRLCQWYEYRRCDIFWAISRSIGCSELNFHERLKVAFMIK